MKKKHESLPEKIYDKKEIDQLFLSIDNLGSFNGFKGYNEDFVNSVKEFYTKTGFITKKQFIALDRISNDMVYQIELFDRIYGPKPKRGRY